MERKKKTLCGLIDWLVWDWVGRVGMEGKGGAYAAMIDTANEAVLSLHAVWICGR